MQKTVTYLSRNESLLYRVYFNYIVLTYAIFFFLGNESEWIDIPDTETPTRLPYIKELGTHFDGTRTPPLPPLSPEIIPKVMQQYLSKAKKQSHSFRY